MLLKARTVLAALALLPLVACQQTASPPPPQGAVSTITPSTFRMPEGSGCRGEVERTRAVMDNDLQMGHVAASVHGRVAREIDQAAALCSSGEEARSVAMINATKSRYGYR
ncbi:hypothetical protein [Microvirga pudoricolor]|uniref:hypothetical protein n=1 Tax=Microvirga pudoricolor TaxID=2778729 RepID=UPI00194ED54E|nr:hypothetical protein [Microvirga pudoricolor]MBM6594524.1 hypothetical protein [Microvirga pudoricolor]